MTRESLKTPQSSETLSPAVLKLIFSEQALSGVKKKRLKDKIDKKAKQGMLTKHFLAKTSPKEHLEWAYRIFCAQMILGDYSWWGWETRSEWCWDLSNRHWFYPKWQGKPCKLFVLGEQGIGDEILFASCLPDLQKTNPDITVECDSRLIPIFERSFPGIKFQSRWKDGIIGSPKELGEYRGDFDAFIPLGNVPKLYRTSRAAFPRTPYLIPDKQRVDKWRDTLPSDAVGIVHTAGGFDEKKVAFEDLIQGTPINIHHRIRVGGVRNEYPADFDDFVGLIAALDHVNCVPSAAAHLCGAIGQKANVVKPPIYVGEANTILKYAYPRESGKMVWYGDHIDFYSSIRDFHYRMRRLSRVV